MLRFKMLGRDVDCNPTQYRTWIVAETPDFTGQFYTGLKSGPNPLADVTAYAIFDDSVVADFSLPNAVDWAATQRVLPTSMTDSSLAVIDGYAYLFGGRGSAKIYQAHTNRPAEWIDTGAVLPAPLASSQLAIINNIIYLFGGNSKGPTDHIYSAHVSNPLAWTDNGSLLPDKLTNAQLIIANQALYLLGGHNTLYPKNTIYTASPTNPLVWTNTGHTIPLELYKSQAAIMDGYVFLMGGFLGSNNPTNYVLSAPLSNIFNWSATGTLPYPSAGGQFFEVGDKGYLITSGSVGTTPHSKGTRIYQCSLSNPNVWIDTNHYVPGEVTGSQVGIINDRLYLFGGNANSVIFVNDSVLKYKFGTTTVVSYGNTTRTIFKSTPNKLDLFMALGFPPWKTDYGS